VFDIGSLTEDYEIGVRLHRGGMKQVFVRQVLIARDAPALVFHRLTGGYSNDSSDAIVVREYFPSRFRAAVKQKSDGCSASPCKDGATSDGREIR